MFKVPILRNIDKQKSFWVNLVKSKFSPDIIKVYSLYEFVF